MKWEECYLNYFLPSSVVPSSWLCSKHEVDSSLLSFYYSFPSLLWSEGKGGKSVKIVQADRVAPQPCSIFLFCQTPSSLAGDFYSLGFLMVQCGCQCSSLPVVLGMKQDQKGLPAVYHPIKEAPFKFYATAFYLTSKT